MTRRFNFVQIQTRGTVLYIAKKLLKHFDGENMEALQAHWTSFFGPENG